LRRELRRCADPPRSGGGGDPPRTAARAAAARTGGDGPARTDAAARFTPRHARLGGWRARVTRGPGPIALGSRADRRRRRARRARAGVAALRRVFTAG